MDEQLRILKMVEEGTITAEQGAELMAAMNIELPARQRVSCPFRSRTFRGWILRLSWRRFPNAWMKRLKETLLMWRHRTERP